MQQHSSSFHKMSFSGLIRSIVTDVKELFAREITLAKLEVHNDLEQTKSAAISFGIGLSIFTMGGALVLLMLVHLVRDFTTLPLWACYGIFGGVCIVLGAIFLKVGSTTAEEIDFTPEETIETLKENVSWLSGKKTTNTNAAHRSP